MRIRPALQFIEQRHYELPLPFHPPERYPEFGWLPNATCPENAIYSGVRNLLRGLGYDRDRFGTTDWSPLSDLVPRGGTVVLKPNFVRHYSENPNGTVDTVVTHPSVLRPLIDYALLAVGPAGQVIVADAPQYDCDIDALLAHNRLPELLDWYQDEVGRTVSFRDLRVQFGRHENGIILERRDLPGDPDGYATVDLGSESAFAQMDDRHLRLLRGADYDEEVTIRHHSGGRNQYLVSRTVLGADLVVNCPKIKTHKKAGITLSMKNLIGINGDKNWLPHYRAGFTAGGGDEFPAADAYARIRRIGGEVARRLLKRGIGGPLFRRIRAVENATPLSDRARNGNWWGNDTIWRTCLDLNKILYHGDADGRVEGPPARRVLNVYDGVVAGEGDGPMGPDARPIGLLAAGEDPGATDAVLTSVMGFDWRRIPVLRNAIEDPREALRITNFRGDAETLPVHWTDSEGERELQFSDVNLNLRFAAHPGWAGRIEREDLGIEQCAS